MHGVRAAQRVGQGKVFLTAVIHCRFHMAPRNFLSLAALATAGGALVIGAAQAAKAELVKNGGFSANSINGSFVSSFLNGTQNVTIDDWAVTTSYSFIVSDGAVVTSNLNESNNGPDPVFGTPIAGKDNVFPLGLYTSGQSVSSPTGSGWFIATDGAYGADAKISQTISGFDVGKDYELSFYYAGGQQQGFTGDAVSSVKVSLGGNFFSDPAPVNLPSQTPVTPWQQYTTTFTASSPSQVLEFIADGAPSGQPPFLLLTGVSIVESAPPLPVPGPLPALGAGVALAWSRNLRRRIAASGKRETGVNS